MAPTPTPTPSAAPAKPTAPTPAPAAALVSYADDDELDRATETVPVGAPSSRYRVRLKRMDVRECADTLAFNPKLSLQDNLNNAVEDRMGAVLNLHRVVSLNYTDSQSLLKRNCALCTVWYEVLEEKDS